MENVELTIDQLAEAEIELRNISLEDKTILKITNLNDAYRLYLEAYINNGLDNNFKAFSTGLIILITATEERIKHLQSFGEGKHGKAFNFILRRAIEAREISSYTAFDLFDKEVFKNGLRKFTDRYDFINQLQSYLTQLKGQRTINESSINEFIHNGKAIPVRITQYASTILAGLAESLAIAFHHMMVSCILNEPAGVKMAREVMTKLINIATDYIDMKTDLFIDLNAEVFQTFDPMMGFMGFSRPRFDDWILEKSDSKY